MWSSYGFNMALFREYLSAAVSSFMDRNRLSFLPSAQEGAVQIPRA